MTSELFAQLIVSDAVVNRIKEYRAKLPELDRLKGAAPDPSEGGEAMRKWQEKCRAITNIKSGLPVLMYQATFDKTVSKKGYEGYWRKQSAARLNGLFMLDVDHIGEGLPPTPPKGEGSLKKLETSLEKTQVASEIAKLTPPTGVKFSLPLGGIKGGLPFARSGSSSFAKACRLLETATRACTVWLATYATSQTSTRNYSREFLQSVRWAVLSPQSGEPTRYSVLQLTLVPCSDTARCPSGCRTCWQLWAYSWLTQEQTLLLGRQLQSITRHGGIGLSLFLVTPQGIVRL